MLANCVSVKRNQFKQAGVRKLFFTSELKVAVFPNRVNVVISGSG